MRAAGESGSAIVEFANTPLDNAVQQITAVGFVKQRLKRDQFVNT